MSNQGNGTRVRTLALIVIGCLLGLVFLYLAFRDISWRDLIQGISEMRLWYLVPAAFLLVGIQFIRAVRFGVILSPFFRLGLKDLWDIVNIWGALNMVLPARLGELVRPYLLRQCGASFSSGFGAVMVERFFDLCGLLTLLAVVLWRTPEIPSKFALVGKLLLAILSLGYIAVLAVLWRRAAFEAFADKMLAWLPERISSFLGGIVRSLIEGLRVMASPWQTLRIFLYSILIWIMFAGITYLFLMAFAINVPFLAAVAVQVSLCFGVALPSAPGFIGVFHAAARFALQAFSVPAVPAISFATVYHLFSLVMSLALGAISWATSDFKAVRNGPDSEEAEELDPANGCAETANSSK